jgi:hypothetical protein
MSAVHGFSGMRTATPLARPLLKTDAQKLPIGGPVNKAVRALLVGVVLVGGVTRAAATPVLQESLFDLNGTTYHNTFAVPGLNAAGFDGTTGLGVLTLTFAPGSPGAYHFTAFLDHQLHVPFYDEFGSVFGPPPAGVSWQIDEPGFGDGNRIGTIFDNAMNNALDNTNHVPGTTSNFLNDCGANTPPAPVDPTCNNDVSMALGFNFILAADEQAVIQIRASLSEPVAGFYLRQNSPDLSQTSALYLDASLAILDTQPVPEPASIMVLAAGLAGVAGVVWRRRARSG